MGDLLKPVGGGGGGAASATVETSLYVDAGAMLPQATAPAEAASEEYATNDINIDHYLFDGAAVEAVQFKWVPPPQWDGGTVDVEYFWDAATGASASDGVTWGAAAVVISNDDPVDVALGTKIDTDDVVTAVGDLHTAQSAAVTIAGTPADGDVVVFEITRETGDAADTMTEDAKLFGVRIHYTNSTAAGGGAWTFLDSATASASASVIFDNEFTSSYDSYVVILSKVAPATDAVSLLMTYRDSSPADLTGTNYGSGIQYVGVTVGGQGDISNQQNTGGFVLGATLDHGNGTEEFADMTITLNTPNISGNKTIRLENVHRTKSALAYYSVGGGYTAESGTPAGIKFAFSSGNIASGEFSLYGVSNS